MFSKMLPPNATPLERAVTDTMPRLLMDQLADAPRGLKSTSADTVLPWLAAEWFLSDFIRYFSDTRSLITAGLPWLRKRGTAAAVKHALTWIGLTAHIENNSESKLQIDTGLNAADVLSSIIHLVNASIPAHVRLYRIYHGYDIRAARCDRNRLDVSQLDGDSGIDMQGVRLSFGTRHAITDDGVRESGGPMLYEPISSITLRRDDSWRLDGWRLDGEVRIIYVGRGVQQVVIALDEPDLPTIACFDYHLMSSALATEQPHAITDVMTQDSLSVLPGYAPRRWGGHWSGQWRNTPSIPSRYFEE